MTGKDRECGVCEKLVRPEQCVWVETGDRVPLAWDTRLKTPGGARLGMFPVLAHATLPSGAWVCNRCRGVDEPPPPSLPLWKQAKAAWDAPGARQEMSYELLKLMPRKRPLFR